jgi:hypothetical protein
VERLIFRNRRCSVRDPWMACPMHRCSARQDQGTPARSAVCSRGGPPSREEYRYDCYG